MKSSQTFFSGVWMVILALTMIPSSTEDSNRNVYNSSFFPVRDPTGIHDPIRNVTVYPEGAIWNAELIQRVVTLALIMVATLIGNMIILLVLSRSRYRKRSSRVNIFILNLAIGDLLVCLITMTSELLFEVSPCNFFLDVVFSLIPSDSVKVASSSRSTVHKKQKL